ncbi:MAG TPA: hypothetical protein VN767_29830 [Streptosporangiaceae bacterium]|nr:hypothetical protein [Streptosporangiaceae bacterium]
MSDSGDPAVPPPLLDRYPAAEVTSQEAAARKAATNAPVGLRGPNARSDAGDSDAGDSDAGDSESGGTDPGPWRGTC